MHCLKLYFFLKKFLESINYFCIGTVTAKRWFIDLWNGFEFVPTDKRQVGLQGKVMHLIIYVKGHLFYVIRLEMEKRCLKLDSSHTILCYFYRELN